MKFARNHDFAIERGLKPKIWGDSGSGGSRKFWWGGFEAQNLKNSDIFTKIESDVSAEIGNLNVFFAQIQVVSKKKKGLHQNWDWFFGRNRKFKRFFRPNSGGLQNKNKKKGLHQNWDWFFAGFVTFRSVGGMHPEMEPNYLKQRLIFRPKSLLLGIPPLNPPLDSGLLNSNSIICSNSISPS